ncbi:MAG TPA: C1 family peptidase [Mycobacteriales bacterium]|nr:C1 family peptidase [Mycobacteriales bacterium]
MADLILDERLLGAYPSHPDHRDYKVEEHLDMAAPLPRRFVLSLLAPVLNQGNTGRCVAFSGTGARQQEERSDGDWPSGWPPLDEEWLYTHAEAIDGLPGPPNDQRGTTVRAALNVLLKQGQPLTGKPATAPEFKIASYHAVSFAAATIKSALAQLKVPIWIATSWYGNWFKPVNGVLPKPVGSVVGGHARFIFGWDDNVAGGSFLVRNSWGAAWGSNGNSYDPYAGCLHAMHDAWTTADISPDPHVGG